MPLINTALVWRMEPWFAKEAPEWDLWVKQIRELIPNALKRVEASDLNDVLSKYGVLADGKVSFEEFSMLMHRLYK
eukprot:gene451-11817_t